MGERVGCNEQVEGSYGYSLPPQCKTHFARVFPKLRRLGKLVASFEQGQYSIPIRTGSKAPVQFDEDWATDRDIVAFQQFVYPLRHWIVPAKEFDPGRCVYEDHARVLSKSRRSRTRPRSARSALRLCWRSNSMSPWTIVSVTPSPVIARARLRACTGTFTVTFLSASAIEPAYHMAEAGQLAGSGRLATALPPKELSECEVVIFYSAFSQIGARRNWPSLLVSMAMFGATALGPDPSGNALRSFAFVRLRSVRR